MDGSSLLGIMGLTCDQWFALSDSARRMVVSQSIVRGGPNAEAKVSAIVSTINSQCSPGSVTLYAMPWWNWGWGAGPGVGWVHGHYNHGGGWHGGGGHGGHR